MIQVQNVTYAFPARTLFKNVNLQLQKGNRYGLVGANGSGKTTFCKILSGELSPTSGSVHFPKDSVIGVLLQNQYAFENEKILDVVLRGKPEMWQAVSEKRLILEKGADINLEDGERLAELEVVLADHDAYRAEAEAVIILEGLGIASELHDSNMSVLSGGYKIRVLLARMLFSEPDFLFLDEPNNHLDLESIRWLETYLLSFKGLVILVSHDHNLINRVSTHILDADYEEIKIYTGNYFSFIEQKQAAEEIKLKNIASQEKRRDELQKFIDKFSAKNTKARQANSKKKIIDKMEFEEIIRSSRRAPRFRFQIHRPSGREVCKIKNLKKKFADKTVLDGVDFQLSRGKRLAVLGYNGAGKSTLLKIMTERLEADSGEVEWGHEAHVGYFAQNQRDLIDDKETPLEWLYRFGPSETVSTIRGILGLMLFSGDDVNKPASALSGGELSRLIFARLLYEKNNVLVLDEPTNHLDLDSIEALIEALKKYPGTLIFVSHDEYFVNRLADSILYFNHEGHKFFDEDYESFKEKYLEAQTPTPKQAKKKNNRSDNFQNQIKKLEREIENLEKKIEESEKKEKEISEALESKNSYSDEQQNILEELFEKQTQNKEILDSRFREWEKAHDKLNLLKKQALNS